MPRSAENNGKRYNSLYYQRRADIQVCAWYSPWIVLCALVWTPPWVVLVRRFLDLKLLRIPLLIDAGSGGDGLCVSLGSDDLGDCLEYPS